MWRPGECVHSCVYVCKGLNDIQGNAWLMIVVFVIGFVTGKLKVGRKLFVGDPAGSSPASPDPREETQQAPPGVSDKNDPSCETKPVELKNSIDKLVTSITKSPQSTPSSSEAGSAHKSGSDSRQSSPGSCSSTSPLLLGWTKHSPTGISDHPSPLGVFPSSPLSRRQDAGVRTESLVVEEEEDPGRTSPVQATPNRPVPRPKPVIIPAYVGGSSGKNSSSPPSSTSSYTSVDSTLPAVAWMCGKNIQFGGERWLDLINRSLDGLYGKDWTLCCHPDDLNHCREIVSSAAAMRIPFQMEYRLKIIGNQYRWILDIAKPRVSISGDFLGFVGWRVDIHERKIIEEKYMDFWTLPHEFLVNWSGDGRYFDNMSAALPTTLGYGYDEFKAKPYMSFVHVDDFDRTIEAAQSLKDGSIVINFANRYRCGPNPIGPVCVDSTGTYKWILWTASRNFGAGKDITSVKVVEEELRQSQQELRRIADLLPGGVFVYRTKEGDESFPYMSRGALEMLGPHNTIESASGAVSSSNRRAFGMTVHADDWDELRSGILVSQDSGAPFDHHFRVESHRKVVQWVRVHAVPEIQDDGSIEWSGIALDETIAHETLDAVKEARDNAVRLAQTKATFLAHMSHEIRTPMNSVVGMCTLLLETPLTDEQRDYASTIRQSGEALVGIINDILDYSKIEAGKMELELRPVNLARCVEETFDSILPQAASKSLELTSSIAGSVPKMVLADLVRVRQILINLLSNAVKFTSQGSVSVSVDGERTAENFWEIHFAVNDTGPGIASNRKNCLFQAFTQIDASTTRRYGGTGLGLVICARLCKLHGGRVWVESEVGTGSTFHFTIRAEEAAVAGSADESLFSSLRGKQVLVVDSWSSNTQAMCANILKRFEMRPICAAGGKEALNLLKTMDRHPFYAVIFNNAVFDAAEDGQALECVKFCQEEAHIIPAVILSSFGDRHREYYYPDSNEAIRFSASVPKPVKELQLRTLLMSFMPDRAPERQPRPGMASSPTSLAEVAKMYPLRILVAEDNLVNQKVITKLLARLGYRSDVAQNGLEALELARKNRYDVCLMDCYMPEMDGLEACRRIRREVDPPPLVVAVTAAALEEEMQQCFDAGMCMCLCKPVHGDDLMQTLQKCWHILNSSDTALV